MSELIIQDECASDSLSVKRGKAWTLPITVVGEDFTTWTDVIVRVALSATAASDIELNTASGVTVDSATQITLRMTMAETEALTIGLKHFVIDKDLSAVIHPYIAGRLEVKNAPVGG